jgi:hypothetical protein
MQMEDQCRELAAELGIPLQVVKDRINKQEEVRNL